MTPDRVPDWLGDGAWTSSTPDEPPHSMSDLWPEDLLSEDEWALGWFDRQVLQGRRHPDERSAFPRGFGGTGGDA